MKFLCKRAHGQKDKRRARFQAATAPTPEKLDALLGRIIIALMKQLTRSGHLVQDEGMSHVRKSGCDAELTPPTSWLPPVPLQPQKAVHRAQQRSPEYSRMRH